MSSLFGRNRSSHTVNWWTPYIKIASEEISLLDM